MKEWDLSNQPNTAKPFQFNSHLFLSFFSEGIIIFISMGLEINVHISLSLLYSIASS
ncbi:hypothetical protein LguiA_026527 [Lonicera macranthoides]